MKHAPDVPVPVITDPNMALITACKANDLTVVLAALHAGADVNALDEKGYSALMDAVDWTPHAEFMIDNVDTVQALVDAGANVNYRGHDVDQPNDPTTPLLIAANHSKWQTVKLLLAHDADVNAAEVDGSTALMSAAGWENTEVVEALLKRGARIDHRSIIYACQFYNGQNAAGVRETVALLLRYGASVRDKDNIGRTALSVVIASNWHDEQLIDMLKRAGARE